MNRGRANVVQAGNSRAGSAHDAFRIVKAKCRGGSWLGRAGAPSRPGAVGDHALPRGGAALKSIDPALDLGGGLTCAALDAAIQTALGRLEAYNTALSQVDAALNELQAAEKALAGLGERCLAAVKGRYGGDSTEYEKAGGTRKSDRKRRTPTPAAARG